MKISIGSDNRGLDHKKAVKKLLAEFGHEVVDHGPFSTDAVDYPDYGAMVADDVAEGRVDSGVTICFSGNGMNMAVNRFPNVRGALVLNAEMSRLARAHNDANVLTLSQEFTPASELREIIKNWLETDFEAGRHERRVEKLRQLECGTSADVVKKD